MESVTIATKIKLQSTMDVLLYFMSSKDDPLPSDGIGRRAGFKSVVAIRAGSTRPRAH